MALPSALERLAASRAFGPEERDLMAFGQFVGAWDLDWTALDDEGTIVERRRGEWHFAWVLGGRGVQDVIWIAGGAPEDDGTTLRCWDAELGAWRSVFMSPGDGEYVTLIGRRDGDQIVQDVVPSDSDAVARRWRFCDISGSEFVWRAEVAAADGGWRVTHEMRASRQT